MELVPTWVTVWVNQLTHSLTHTEKSKIATKKPQKPKFSRLFGAARQIRTADLILTNWLGAFQPLIFNAFRSFLLQKDEVGSTLYSVGSV
ncbi:hypothetical protein B5E43_12270 [Flavonifractor sp. An100]|nr:hypothetical protein B5E43_12270 [Flavonifractor sp. An100]